MSSNTPAIFPAVAAKPVVAQSLRVEVVDFKARMVDVSFLTITIASDEEALGQMSAIPSRCIKLEYLRDGR
jgi:hypothetical protein